MIAMKKNSKNPKPYHKYLNLKKTFEANILSKLPCDTMKYNLMYMLKNLTIRKQKNYLIKHEKYTKN